MADFTKEQTLAITTLDRNVSVSAGAGSGKTRVLVERFLTILKDPDKSANRILAITFTRKAAREMRERIRKSSWKKWGRRAVNCGPISKNSCATLMARPLRPSMASAPRFCAIILLKQGWILSLR